MAAEKKTVANPAAAQMKMTTSMIVFRPGAEAGGLRLPRLRSTSQILSPSPPKLAGSPGTAFATWLASPFSKGGPA
jgi:hypothetical protein